MHGESRAVARVQTESYVPHACPESRDRRGLLRLRHERTADPGLLIAPLHARLLTHTSS